MSRGRLKKIHILLVNNNTNVKWFRTSAIGQDNHLVMLANNYFTPYDFVH